MSANDNNPAPPTPAEAAASILRLAARGMLPADLAERLAEDVLVPGAPDRYQGWIVERDGRHARICSDDKIGLLDGIVAESIADGLGRIGYIKRNGRLLYHIGRSPRLKLLPS